MNNVEFSKEELVLLRKACFRASCYHEDHGNNEQMEKYDHLYEKISSICKEA